MSLLLHKQELFMAMFGLPLTFSTAIYASYIHLYICIYVHNYTIYDNYIRI